MKADAALLYSGKSPEPDRAEWIVQELTALGVTTIYGQYQPGEDLVQLMEELAQQARHVVVLFSAATVDHAGEAFGRFMVNGHRPIPVRCEDHEKYPYIADIVHANIFGTDPERDNAQLEKLARAVRS